MIGVSILIILSQHSETYLLNITQRNFALGYWTKFSMIPITIGLCLCSSFELSFDIFGFLCALGTNVFDW